MPVKYPAQGIQVNYFAFEIHIPVTVNWPDSKM